MTHTATHSPTQHQCDHASSPTQHRCDHASSPTRLPCNGGYLEEEVERHPGEDSVSEELDDAEEGEHDPVREPLRVILLVLRVNGLAPVDKNRS